MQRLGLFALLLVGCEMRSSPNPQAQCIQAIANRPGTRFDPKDLEVCKGFSTGTSTKAGSLQ